MDCNQAAAAIAAYFHVKQSQLLGDCRIPVNAKEAGSLAYSRSLSYDKGGISLSASMIERIPIDKGRPHVVISVIYRVDSTPQNQAALAKVALAKYGTPTVNNGPLAMMWCAAPAQYSGCVTVPTQSELELGGTELVLRDPTWQVALDKYELESRSVKPNP